MGRRAQLLPGRPTAGRAPRGFRDRRAYRVGRAPPPQPPPFEVRLEVHRPRRRALAPACPAAAPPARAARAGPRRGPAARRGGRGVRAGARPRGRGGPLARDRAALRRRVGARRPRRRLEADDGEDAGRAAAARLQGELPPGDARCDRQVGHRRHRRPAARRPRAGPGGREDAAVRRAPRHDPVPGRARGRDRARRLGAVAAPARAASRRARPSPDPAHPAAGERARRRRPPARAGGDRGRAGRQRAGGRGAGQRPRGALRRAARRPPRRGAALRAPARRARERGPRPLRPHDDPAVAAGGGDPRARRPGRRRRRHPAARRRRAGARRARGVGAAAARLRVQDHHARGRARGARDERRRVVPRDARPPRSRASPCATPATRRAAAR